MFQVHDRAQVFISCPSQDGHGKPIYVGTFERWLNQPLTLPNTKCLSKISLYVLVPSILPTFSPFISFYFHFVSGKLNWGSSQVYIVYKY